MLGAQRAQRHSTRRRSLDLDAVLVREHPRERDDRHAAGPSPRERAPTRTRDSAARRESSSSGMWQRSAWVSLVARHGGSTSSQTGPTFQGQRSANGHALAGRYDDTPGSLRTAGEIVLSPSISGTAESSMCV